MMNASRQILNTNVSTINIPHNKHFTQDMLPCSSLANSSRWQLRSTVRLCAKCCTATSTNSGVRRRYLATGGRMTVESSVGVTQPSSAVQPSSCSGLGCQKGQNAMYCQYLSLVHWHFINSINNT